MSLAVRRHQVEDTEISFLAIILSILILIIIAFYTFIYGIPRLMPVHSAGPEGPVIIEESV